MPEPKLTAYNQGSKHTVTIASGASLSTAAAIPVKHTLVGILMPAAWDAASLTFQGSWDGAAYGNVYTDDGTEAQVPAAAGHAIYVDTAALRAFPFLKVRSGTAATPVNQTAQRTITLISRP